MLVDLARRAQARPPLRSDRQGGTTHARFHRPRRDDDHRALAYSFAEGGFQRDEDSEPLSDDYDLVIVDEASMLSLELADALFRALGNCHVLLVGDTDELPSRSVLGCVLADLVASETGCRAST